MSDLGLERWIDALLATPGLTAVGDRREAWRVHVEGSLAALDAVDRWPGAIVDVGSGGGSPGIPIALARPHRHVTLLEANGRKAAFLERFTAELPNVAVIRGRAEEQETEAYGVAVARALAPPPVAVEWCLPLVRPGGAAVLLVGRTADTDRVARAAVQVGGGAVERSAGVLVIPKVTETPAGFPRKSGIARKRPLA